MFINQGMFFVSVHRSCFCLLFQRLLLASSQDVHNDLLSGYEMLTNPRKMGERFKFLAIMSKCVYHDVDSPVESQHKPAGFVPAY